MLGYLRKSWYFSKISYQLLWNHKKLLIFPLLSAIAESIVFLSFIFNFFYFLFPKLILHLIQSETGELDETGKLIEYVFIISLFLFYLVTNAVILIFNTGLIACVLRILQGYNQGKRKKNEAVIC